MGVVPGCGGGDAGSLTSFSIDGEYTSDTLSARRGSILPASVAILMVGTNLTGNSRASSLTCLKPWPRPSRPADQHWVLERRSETLESILVALFFGRLR